jgi:hypothetical protein
VPVPDTRPDPHRHEQSKDHLQETRPVPRQGPTGYPNRRNYDEPAGYPDIRKDFPSSQAQSHYQYSPESITSAEQQSVSSGRRTPPFADRWLNNAGDNGFVSGSQSLVNTPPLAQTPPIAWRQHKAAVPHEMTAAYEADSRRPDVVDKDLLIAATRKIEAAAREHPGWSSVEATIADRKMKEPKYYPDRMHWNENTGSGNASHEHMYPSSRREAQLQYQARASAQARQLTHYAPPENLLKLHEQVAAKSAARANAVGRSQGFEKMKPVGRPPATVVAKKSSTQWDGHFNGYSEKPSNNMSMMGNGTRFEGCGLDLRFLDDESTY